MYDGGVAMVYVFMDIIIIIIGIVMISKPHFVYRITEGWKVNGEKKPSKLYVLEIRFGGIMFLAAGIGCGILELFVV